MYGFRKESFSSLNKAAYEAAQRIYCAGLMFREGVLGPGGNNVMADNAARAFTPSDLEELRASEDPLDHGLAQIIALRQDYINGTGAKGDSLREIYKLVEHLEGFTPQSKLVSVGTARLGGINNDRAQIAALGDHFRRAASGESSPPADPVKTGTKFKGMQDLSKR